MKVILPSHLDAGNRGCEAIAKGTIQILDTAEKILLISHNIQLDSCMNYSNSKIIDIYKHPFVDKVINKLQSKVLRKTKGLRYKYAEVFKQYRSGDVILSTGGDLFCYQDNLESISLVDDLTECKIPVILWGCSIGEENLTPRKMEVLKKFSAITVRESLTESVLKEKLGLKNVYRYPDPAFVLKPEACALPDYFDKNVIGINLSNFVGANVDFDTMVGKNLLELFHTILRTTDMDIVLIPHVFWEGQDDRIVCSAFYERFRDTGRVFLLDTEKMNYCQIRYAISKCRFFIGARTHAMISAYSTCVPALALGYSIKSIGIAKDLGLSKELVADYRTLASVDAFSSAFTYLLSHETEIKNHMQTVMPAYIQKAYEMKKVVEML